MSKAVVADIKPIARKLSKGETHYWCRCGRSKNQPFCDGSHAGTDFKPLQFEAKEDGDAYLCMCKQTGNAPYCDGSHKHVKKEETSEPAEERSGTETAANVKSTREEPYLEHIHELAEHGLDRLGHHGEMVAMGVPRYRLPDWNDIQILPAQLARKPLQDEAEVGTEVVIGPNAKRPLKLDIALMVSDMSFGALSEEAKIALATGAELAGTGICSGEGGMLPEEQQANSRYFYELASAKFGFHEGLLSKVQAFHFKAGQAAKTGTGGHLPAGKVTDKIASVRCINKGESAVSPSTFTDLVSSEDFKAFGDRVREITGGIPIGMKMSANHIEADIQFALDAGVDYIILDGRGGGTGAAPAIFRDHISIPTMAALARARHYLDRVGRPDVTLVITGGLRTAADFVKALALGADAVAVSNSAMQAIGCVGARMCNTNLCPAGIATQNPELRARLDVEKASQRLQNFFEASTRLMQTMARACGHDQLGQFNRQDITSFKKDISELTGIAYAGFDANRGMLADE